MRKKVYYTTNIIAFSILNSTSKVSKVTMNLIYFMFKGKSRDAADSMEISVQNFTVINAGLTEHLHRPPLQCSLFLYDINFVLPNPSGIKIIAPERLLNEP